jgi:beta-mannanase
MSPRPEPTFRHRALGRVAAVVLLLLTSMAIAPTSAAALISPRTRVDTPLPGSLVVDDVKVRGVAAHPRGVASVDVVLKNLDNDTYWNGNGWQSAFVRLSIPVRKPGATRSGWAYTVDGDNLIDGNYRARAFARSVDGNGDGNGGDSTEFRYRATPDLFDTEILGPPAQVADDQVVVVEGRTVSAEGVGQVLVAIRHQPTGKYWNARRNKWQNAVVRNVADLSDPGATDVAWRVELPANRTKLGGYSAVVLARTGDGVTDSSGVARTEFEVVATDDCPDGDPSILVPCAGVIIGSTGDPRARDGSFQSKQAHFLATEQKLGTEFDLFHNFRQWDDLVSKQWPAEATQALADDGRLLMTNWKSPTSSPNDWSRIAAGDYDDDIEAAAAQMAAFGEPTFITFYHEPEDNIRDAAGGDPAKVQQYIDDYAAAFRHLHDMFEANGATNAIWVWDMQGWIGGWEGYYLNGLYPGDDVVDWVAWNPYNWYGCENHGNQRRWRPFEDVVGRFYDWLEEGGSDRPSLDKPLMLGEWGTEENDGADNSDQTKAEWLDDARRLLPTRFPRLKAVVYFNTEGRRADGSVQFCEWAIDSSPEAVQSMANLLNDATLTARW